MADDDKRIERIEEKVDKILEQHSVTNITLAAQHVVLTEHIRRTEILEAKVEPMVHSWSMVKGACKLIAGMLLLAGSIEGIVVLLEYIKK